MQSMQMIEYEQPINELVRACLRVEHLTRKINYFFEGNNIWDNRACIAAMIDLMNLLDRPDLRNKLTQEVSRQLSALQRFLITPQVDHEKLTLRMKNLESIFNLLHSQNGKFAEKLRNNEFIKSIASHHLIAGGTCEYNTPGFHLWLSQTKDIKRQQIECWLTSFADIIQISSVLLGFIRESGLLNPQVATAGFMQLQLDPSVPCQLIRVLVPLHYQVFPNISLGRHGMIIRFLDANAHERAQQTKQNVEFELACCIF